MESNNKLGTLEQKDLKDFELLSLHKGIYVKFLKENNLDFKKRTILENLYDALVTTDNIRLFYNRTMNIFTQALVNNDLQSIVKHGTHSA